MANKKEKIKKKVRDIKAFLKLNEGEKKEYIKTLSVRELWSLVIAIGRKKEPSSKGITNKFDKDDVMTIVATMEFFGATTTWIQQTIYDLMGPPRFRLFDKLGMDIMSRNNDNRGQNNVPLKVLVWAYLKVNGDPKKFVQELRVTDYQLDESYNCIHDIIEW